MSVVTVIIILLVVGAFLLLGLLLYVNWSLKKQAKNSVLAFFLTDTGMYEEMLPVKEGKAVAPQNHIPLFSKKEQPEAVYDLPEKKIYTQWPTWGWPQAFRVEVRCVLYREGNKRPLEWGTGTPYDGSAKLQAATMWDKSAENILGKVGEALEGFVGGLKPSHFWIGIGCIALMIVIFGIVTWLTYSNLTNLTSLWGL